LINDVDRLARDVAHLAVIKRDLEHSGVRVIFRKLPPENSPTANLMINILGSFAEFERELIADRTRRGRRYKVEVRQQYLGSNTAYGYRYVPADKSASGQGYLEVIAEEAAVVRQMFVWVDKEGLSSRRVIDRLAELGIRPRKGDGRWARSSVLRILRNEMYAGVWYYNKHRRCEPETSAKQRSYLRELKSSTRKRPKTEWLALELPPNLRITPRDRWRRVQRQLDCNITFSPRHEKHPYLLKSLIRCGGCGARYVGDPNHGKFYYRCHARCKTHPMIREEVLNITVWEAITEVLIEPDRVMDQVTRRRENIRSEASQQVALRKDAEHELAQVRREESRILEAYRLGAISPAQLGRELETLKQREGAAEQSLATVEEDESFNPQTAERSVREYCREIAQSLETIDQPSKQQLLRTLVREIIFEGDRVRIRGQFPTDGDSPPLQSTPNSPPTSLINNGRIVTTTVGHCGRNEGREDTRVVKSSRYRFCKFEIACGIAQAERRRQPRDTLGRFSGPP
jgi:site-specific DNA recombinase